MWGYLGKLIVAKGFKKLPKVQSGHTDINNRNTFQTASIYHTYRKCTLKYLSFLDEIQKI